MGGFAMKTSLPSGPRSAAAGRWRGTGNGGRSMESRSSFHLTAAVTQSHSAALVVGPHVKRAGRDRGSGLGRAV